MDCVSGWGVVCVGVRCVFCVVQVWCRGWIPSLPTLYLSFSSLFWTYLAGELTLKAARAEDGVV